VKATDLEITTTKKKTPHAAQLKSEKKKCLNKVIIFALGFSKLVATPDTICTIMESRKIPINYYYMSIRK
jgi:hypothetical protein